MSDLKFLSVGWETDRNSEDYGKCFLAVATQSGRSRRIPLQEKDLLRIVVQSVQLMEYLERERREKVSRG